MRSCVWAGAVNEGINWPAGQFTWAIVWVEINGNSIHMGTLRSAAIGLVIEKSLMLIEVYYEFRRLAKAAECPAVFLHKLKRHE